MSRNSKKVPSYCLHKASGRAVVKLNGRDHYLGPFGSDESHEAYQRLIAAWRVNAQQAALLAQDPKFPLSVAQVVNSYREFVEEYYQINGKQTSEVNNVKYAMRPLLALYSRTPARDFGPLALQAVRKKIMEDDKNVRKQINKMIERIRRCFRWACSQELVPASVPTALATVQALAWGKTAARELPPIKPIEIHWVEATIPFMSPTVAAMVQTQLLCGMRPQDVVYLKSLEIDQTEEVWLFQPANHKTAWRGHDRTVFIGLRAQQILAPFLGRSPEKYLFSPIEAAEWHSQQKRMKRKTPMTPSQRVRKRKLKPERAKRTAYDINSYRRAIHYAIVAANKLRKADEQIPRWCPLQIRHTAGTAVREKFGLDGAQVFLGHKHLRVSEVYAERNKNVGRMIANHMG